MENERGQDRVVGVSNHREEIGNEVDGHGEIREKRPGREPS
jgi:hypothetical protein